MDCCREGVRRFKVNDKVINLVSESHAKVELLTEHGKLCCGRRRVRIFDILPRAKRSTRGSRMSLR